MTGREAARADGRGPRHVLLVRDLAVCDAAGRVLVDGASLAVGPEERVGVVGESGAGKTLLMRACLGLLPAGLSWEAGELALVGRDVRPLRPRELAHLLGTRVGFVPQNTMEYLQPLMRVRDQMTDGYRTHHPGAPRADAVGRARGLLEACGFDDPDRVLAARPAELSGGMRQRVNVACALMGEPALVVADEPTAALDAVVARQVVELLVRLTSERGAALVMVSHNLDMVRSCCDRLVVMRAGRVVEEGRAADVFERPRTAYARELAAAVPRLGAVLEARAAAGKGAARPEVGAEAGATHPADGVPPLLEARGVSRAFGRRGAFVAVDGVSLRLPAGGALGVVGESGSGKSTLGEVLGGLQPASGGAVLFEGREVGRLGRAGRRAYRRAVQFVFQDPVASINPSFTVARALADVQRVLFPRRSRAEAAARSREMLGRVGLDPDAVLPARARELSGGQAQRVAIARALLAEPRVLVCDECTSALDVTVQAQVCDLLTRLREELGCALLFISHDMGVVARMADEVLVMRDGRVVESGAVTDVLGVPRQAYTRELVAAAFGAPATGKGAVR